MKFYFSIVQYFLQSKYIWFHFAMIRNSLKNRNFICMLKLIFHSMQLSYNTIQMLWKCANLCIKCRRVKKENLWCKLFFKTVYLVHESWHTLQFFKTFNHENCTQKNRSNFQVNQLKGIRLSIAKTYLFAFVFFDLLLCKMENKFAKKNFYYPTTIFAPFGRSKRDFLHICYITV